MWGKFIVEAKSKSSGEHRTLEVGCMGEAEALRCGRTWFPEDRFTGHTVRPKRNNQGKGMGVTSVHAR